MLRFLDGHYFALPLAYRVLIALAALAIIGLWAWWKRQLTLSGLAAAIVMGLASTLAGGFTALSLYLFFLLSAAIIGKLSRRISGLEKIHKKGGRRDWIQVLANGAPAMLAIIIAHYEGSVLFPVVFAACLGEACGDTWASEIGVLSRKDPVSILTFTKVIRGMSIHEGGRRRMMDAYGIFSASERLLMELGKRGADRQEMHEVIREESLKAWDELQEGRPNNLRENLMGDRRILDYLSAEEIDGLLDATSYTGDAEERCELVISKARKALGRP